MDVLFPQMPLDESRMRAMANQCGKALLFQNREVWQRKEKGALMPVVLFVGKSGLSLRNKVLSPQKEAVEKTVRDDNKSWKVDSEGTCLRSDGKPCFVIVTDCRAKEQRRIVKNILVSVFDVQLRPDGSRLNLSGTAVPFAFQMDANCTMGNPDLQRRLDNASHDIEMLGLGSLGLDWIREHRQLQYVAERFKKLIWLDLSMNSLGGELFEVWLFNLLTSRPKLKVIVYGTIWVICSNWKDRCPANLRERVIVSYHSFSKLKVPTNR